MTLSRCFATLVVLLSLSLCDRVNSFSSLPCINRSFASIRSHQRPRCESSLRTARFESLIGRVRTKEQKWQRLGIGSSSIALVRLYGSMSSKESHNIVQVSPRELQESGHKGNSGQSVCSAQRRYLLQGPSQVALLLSGLSIAPLSGRAAPPISIIAEELGYFPATNSQGETMYIPKRVQRESSQQAVELAQYLSKSGVVMYGAYWCPHCSRQKELFGREAWKYVEYVECAPKGYNAKVKLCNRNNVDGFPTWRWAGNNKLAGEVPLSALAEATRFPKEFRDDLEKNVPPMIGSGSCQ